MRSSSVAICLGGALVLLLLRLGGASCSPLAGAGIAPNATSVAISLETVPDIDAFRRVNADLTVTPLQAKRADGATGRQQIVYTLGSRAAGDRLVGLASDNMSWATPQNVKLEVRYPTAGVGAYVSYVEVVVNQSSANGRGYVVSGGVGQRAVHLVIEAYDTVYFNYAAGIYGF